MKILRFKKRVAEAKEINQYLNAIEGMILEWRDDRLPPLGAIELIEILAKREHSMLQAAIKNARTGYDMESMVQRARDNVLDALPKMPPHALKINTSSRGYALLIESGYVKANDNLAMNFLRLLPKDFFGNAIMCPDY